MCSCIKEAIHPEMRWWDEWGNWKNIRLACQTTTSTIRLLLPNTQLSQRTEAGVEFEVLSCAWRGGNKKSRQQEKFPRRRCRQWRSNLLNYCLCYDETSRVLKGDSIHDVPPSFSTFQTYNIEFMQLPLLCLLLHDPLPHQV